MKWRITLCAVIALSTMAVASCVGDAPSSGSDANDASSPDAAGDSGNANDAGADAALDAAPALQIFVSHDPSQGNLGGDAGAAGIDALCTSWGSAQIAGSKWIALAWDATSAPSDRLNAATGPWVLRKTSTLVFATPADFAAGPLVPIDVDQYGNTVSKDNVWTGYPDADFDAGGFRCDQWSSLSPNRNTVAGDLSEQGKPGLAELALTCDIAARVYCLQIQ